MEFKDFDDLNPEKENDLDLSSNDSEVFDLNSFIFNDNNATEQPVIKNSKKKKRFFNKTNILRTILTMFLVCVITGCIVAGSLIVYVFTFVDGKMDEDLYRLELSYTTTIYSQNSDGNWVEYQRLHGGDNRIWVDYDKDLAMANDPDYKGIPQNLANAFIAIEDKRFMDHDGVDWRRTIMAFVNMVVPTRSKFGGSTITQQLVKNLTADDDQKASRKVREIMRARFLEGKYTKEIILECYLNTISMGKGMCGVEVPAEYYFGKKVYELSLAECASLAAITKSPESYRPDKKPENNLDRRNDVLYEMYDQGYITKEEYDAAVAEELVVVADSSALKETEINSYFTDALIEDVIDTLTKVYGYEPSHASVNFYNGGYKIYSTIDPKVQKSLENVFTDTKYALAGKKGATMQGAMTVMDYQGHIKGLVGGIGKKTENRVLNRATSSPRQPGSTIKPLTAYSLAIEKNFITYSSFVNDMEQVYYKDTVDEWTPVNWYKSYWGRIPLKRAIEQSTNTVAVQLVDLVTPKEASKFLTETLQFKNLNKHDVYYAPLGLGGTNGGVTTEQSAAAFAIFGNKGLYYEPVTFVELYDQYGNLIAENKKAPTVAISEDTATIMNRLLQNVVTTNGATGDDLLPYMQNVKVYAKTGTSDDANDLWFVGGTPYYVASAWCGFDSPQDISQTKIALKMWGSVMSQVHADLPEKDFEYSSYVQCRLYCLETGEIATDLCPVSDYGWYKMSNQKVCSKHGGESLDINTESGASDYLNSSEESSSGEETSSSTTSGETSSSESSSDTSAQTQTTSE